MKNPKTSKGDLEAYVKERNKAPNSLFEISLAWEDIEMGLLNGLSKKIIWEWLVDRKRFSHNYSTFLRAFSTQVKLNKEKKRKALLEQQTTTKTVKENVIEDW